jgi:hypothetical protein
MSGLLLRAVAPVPLKQLLITDLRHPFRPREMTVERTPRPTRPRSASMCSTIPETSRQSAPSASASSEWRLGDEMLFVAARERWIGSARSATSGVVGMPV